MSANVLPLGDLVAALGDLSDNAQAAIVQLSKALPPVELRAVLLWLTTFYPFQREWILDWNRFALLNKSRQIGASHTFAGAGVLWGMFGETTTVISIGEREALEVLVKVGKHATALERLGSQWAKPEITLSQIRLASGGRVLALPASSGGRSYSGNVILDEVAYQQRPEMVWDGAGGTVMHGYKLRALSTPNGVGNFWHALWTDPKQHAGYSLHEVTIDEAIEQGLKVDLDECWRMARNDPRVFDQLFRCSFIDSAQQYIPSEAIEACSVEDLYCYGGECYAGLDIGKTSDRTELVIIRKGMDGTMWQQFVGSCKRTSWDDIRRLVAKAFSREYQCRRLCVDASGLGAFPAEELQRAYGEHLVEAVNFTASVKEDLATTLYSAFMERRIRIDRNDETMRNDVRSLRRIVTSAGNVRYDAPHTREGHADRAWALALAVHSCSRPENYRVEIPGS